MGINIMKLVFILAVLSLAVVVVAASPDDSINNNVQMRIERDAGKKSQRKRIQKAKMNKKAKNRTNKKKKAKSGKLKRERKPKCARGKQGKKCRQNQRKNRQSILGPSCPPTPTCPPPTPAPAPTPATGCSAVNTAYTQYKRATNWMKQCTRVNNWNTIITNKGGKKDDF